MKIFESNPIYRQNCFLACFFGLVTLLSLRTSTFLQSTVLSNDLIITADITGTDTILGRLDAQTLKIVPFYTDANASYVRALSWSPNGDLLAILRVPLGLQQGLTQICILDRKGILKNCAYDKVPDRDVNYNDNYRVTWSADEHYITFLSGTLYTKHLISVDTTTGITARDLFDYTDQDQGGASASISWTPALDFVTVSGGTIGEMIAGTPTILINLKTRQQLNLTNLVAAQKQTYFLFCSEFSPKGTYLAGYSISKTLDDKSVKRQFIIFDKQGNPIKVIDKSNTKSSDEIPEQCPVWHSDESGFYFNAPDIVDGMAPHIDSYDLATGKINIYYQADPNVEQLSSELIFSPAENNFAYEILGTGMTSIIIDAPGKQPQQFFSPYTSVEHAVWVPNLPHQMSLHLTASCSAKPDLYRVWHVTNPTTADLAFNWEVVGTTQAGIGLAKAASDTTFQTTTITSDPNTVRISVNGTVQDIQNSDPSQCGAPSPTPTATMTPTPTFTPTATVVATPLKLTSLCSPSPATSRVWRVRNANGSDIPFTWDVYGTPQNGAGIAKANSDTIFQTTTIPNSPNTVRIFVNGVLQNTKASNPAQCPTSTPTVVP